MSETDENGCPPCDKKTVRPLNEAISADMQAMLDNKDEILRNRETHKIATAIFELSLSKDKQDLLKEGRDFLAQAMATCKACHKYGNCNACGCGPSFSIKGGKVIKSTCLLERW